VLPHDALLDLRAELLDLFSDGEDKLLVLTDAIGEEMAG